MGEGDYDGAGPGYGPPTLFSAGVTAHFVLLFVILLLLVLVAWFAYRMGKEAQRRRIEEERAKTPEVIFRAIRNPLNGALLATGQRVFGPARGVLEVIDLYLGAVLLLLPGLKAIERLRCALEGKATDCGVHPPPPATHTSPATVIFAAPVAVSGGATAAGRDIASAALAEAQPAAHGAHEDHGHPGGHGHGGGHGHDHAMSAQEQARAVRDALETLSDYWQEDTVKRHIADAQKALLISKPIGTVGEKAAERAMRMNRRGVGIQPSASKPDGARGLFSFLN